MVWGSRVGIRLAELPETLLECMLLCYTNAVELAWRQSGIDVLSCPSTRLLIDGFDILSPGSQCLILGKVVFPVMYGA